MSSRAKIRVEISEALERNDEEPRAVSSIESRVRGAVRFGEVFVEVKLEKDHTFEVPSLFMRVR
jgi:hypothetical protein